MYLIIHSTTGYFKENNGEKYLILDPIEKYKEVFSGFKSEIETINGGENLFYEKNYAKIGVNTDDDIPLDKPLKFPSLITIIRCAFQNGKILYPQIYLDECLYELWKMLEDDRTDISEGVDVMQQINRKNVYFVIVGIFYIKTLVMDHIFVMVAII